MLDGLKGFLTSIGNIITSLVDFIIGFVEDVVYVVKLCTSFVGKIPTLFSWLPTEALAIVTIIFSIVIIYKIMGREG